MVLDKGKKDGLLVGMELCVTDHEMVKWLTITKVEAKTSEALMCQTREETPGPKVGWKLSTRARWHPIDDEKPEGKRPVKKGGPSQVP